MGKIKRTYKGDTIHEQTFHALIDETLGIDEHQATMSGNILSFGLGEMAGSETAFTETNGEVTSFVNTLKEKTSNAPYMALDETFLRYQNKNVKKGLNLSSFAVRRNGQTVKKEEYAMSSDGILTFGLAQNPESKITVDGLEYTVTTKTVIERDVDGLITGFSILREE